jgi:hypothetical protein
MRSMTRLLLAICSCLTSPCQILNDMHNVCFSGCRREECIWFSVHGTWYMPAVQEDPCLLRQHHGSEYETTIYKLAPWPVGENKTRDWRLNVVSYLKRPDRKLWSKPCVHLSLVESLRSRQLPIAGQRLDVPVDCVSHVNVCYLGLLCGDQCGTLELLRDCNEQPGSDMHPAVVGNM